MIGVNITGVRELEISLGQLAGALPADIDKAARQTSLAVQRHAVKSIMRGNPRGRQYKRGTKIHTASAAGQAPASDTGRLAGSILPPRRIARGYEVGTNLDYGRYLEFGTRGGRILERPWLRPALDIERPKFIDRVRKLLKGKGL